MSIVSSRDGEKVYVVRLGGVTPSSSILGYNDVMASESERVDPFYARYGDPSHIGTLLNPGANEPDVSHVAVAKVFVDNPPPPPNDILAHEDYTYQGKNPSVPRSLKSNTGYGYVLKSPVSDRTNSDASFPQQACYENPLFEEDGQIVTEAHTKLHKQPDGLKTNPYDLNSTAQSSVHYKQSTPRRTKRLYILGALIALLAVIAIAVAVIVGQRADNNKNDSGGTADASRTTVSNREVLFRTRTVDGKVRVVQGPFSSYSSHYSNKSSASHIMFSSSFIYQMNIIFRRSTFSSSYSSTEVVNISSGNVGVDFVLHFRHQIAIYRGTSREMAAVIQDGLRDSLFIIDTSSIILTPKDPALSVIPTSKPGVCVYITSQHCSSVLPWQQTTFPNVLGHTSPSQVEAAENELIELVAQNGCGKDFWCTLLYPNCVQNRPVPPCRSFCQAVFHSCEEQYRTNISALIDCNSLPESDDLSVCEENLFKPGSCHSNVLDGRCAGLGYSEVAFPNFAMQRSQYLAAEWIVVIDHINNATHCYKYAHVFACYAFMPKCSGSQQVPQHAVPPCRSLCNAFKNRCAIFMDIFWYPWPKSMMCDQFPDSTDPNVCMGYNYGHAPPTVEECPTGEERCDEDTCVPLSWRCDGYSDCKDGADEAAIQTIMPLRKCVNCPADMYRCSFESAVCIENSRRCDGVEDCPTASDERECVQLGAEGASQGPVTVYTGGVWSHVCMDGWTDEASDVVCEQMEYTSYSASAVGVPLPIQTPLFKLTTPKNGTDPQYISSRLRSVTSCPGNTVVKVTCGHPVCGTRPGYVRPATRVVGGDIADPGAWPWQVSVFGGVDQSYFCGATIIDKDWILTAGHCIGGRQTPKHMLLRAGQPRRNTWSPYTQELVPAQFYVHPGYDPHTVDNDIALIRLNNSVRFNDHVRPICLPATNDRLLVGTRCTVIGWGKQGDSATDYEREIRQTNLEVTDWDDCKYGVENAEIKVPYKLSDNMFCAGGGLGHDSCSGDSGGPFLCQSDKASDTWFVGGIVSWGVACAYPNVPGVYTNVPGYLEWIRNITGLTHI